MVPFSATIKAGANRSQSAAEQFQHLLASNATDGFEYFRMDHYSLYQQPGCMAGLLGGKATQYTYDVAVFRRER